MDKIYIIKYKERFLRAYLSKTAAEKYYQHVKEDLQAAERFIREKTTFYDDKPNLQLIAIPISQEEEDLNMRLSSYTHAGGGETAITYDLCPV